MKNKTIWIVAGVVLVAAVTVVVIVSQPRAKSLATSSTTTSPSVVTTTSTIPHGTTIPYSSKNNARRDVVAVQPCTNVNSTWQFHGTVQNSRTVALKYQLVLDFVTSSGGTVLDEKIVNLNRVAPAQKVAWKVAGAHGQSGVSCVLVSARALPVS